MPKYYICISGKKPGIFLTSWDCFKNIVEGYPGNKFISMSKLSDAIKYWHEHRGEVSGEYFRPDYHDIYPELVPIDISKYTTNGKKLNIVSNIPEEINTNVNFINLRGTNLLNACNNACENLGTRIEGMNLLGDNINNNINANIPHISFQRNAEEGNNIFFPQDNANFLNITFQRNPQEDMNLLYPQENNINDKIFTNIGNCDIIMKETGNDRNGQLKEIHCDSLSFPGADPNLIIYDLIMRLKTFLK